MWMDLETLYRVKSEKEKYHILTYICGIQKSGIDDLMCKTETHREQIYGYQGETCRWEQLGDWD